jgi:hypothetical protein
VVEVDSTDVDGLFALLRARDAPTVDDASADSSECRGRLLNPAAQEAVAPTPEVSCARHRKVSKIHGLILVNGLGADTKWSDSANDPPLSGRNRMSDSKAPAVGNAYREQKVRPMSLVKPVISAEDKSERSAEEALATMTNVEGEIREFVRRDVVSARRSDVDLGAGNINFLIERVAGSSIKEIDNLIADLETVREFLRSEGERVAHEITSYAQASQAAMSSAKVVSDSMTQWKSAVGAMKADQQR